ncbi:putative membrane protein [Actinoplanes campanulatus]|uniref:Putative membrane protein n=1 Tax=Actinoplanes campanulatus TaxID=113559 RepID=A0A7W5AKZ2_9ACTN|nr:YhgE/Pip domain-containing protein [Actinoplanes campanulatus]MBB3098188.1 putative membrane protein [Actinoplanes campanulatus]GGN35041.1 membrane protein [Actinoplanes campanulatus]GID38853.1 membrane protein [Actinoplanes campanulatus]
MRGFPTLSLAAMELRRFLRGRLTAAALAVLAVIPLLYGALYLYAFWDPYGRLNHIPAALVVEDQPARTSEGETVHAGKDLADELVERQIFDWHVVNAQDAEEGLRDGSYQIGLRIPADFSASLAAAPESDREPRNAQLKAISDDATNYLSGVFARTAFDEVRAAASASASAEYFDRMLIGFTDLKEETGKAANGAADLRDGARKATSGAGQLANRLDSADDGAGRLASGLRQAGSGVDGLADGLQQLKTGSAQVASGTAEAARGTRKLADKVDAAADTYGPFLTENAKEIEAGAKLVARGADKLADHVGDIEEASDRAVTEARKLRKYLDGLPSETPGLADAQALADRLVSDAEQVQRQIDAVGSDELRRRLHEVADMARDLAKNAPHLAADITKARAQVNRLADGMDELAAGSRKVSAGNAEAAKGATELRGGIFRLASGARQLDGGLTKLSKGGHELATGLGELRSGAGQLADGLADGAAEIPGYDDAAHRADVLADPVSLDRDVRHPAGTYGVGFAPYFLALALWVGAMINYMLLRPLNRRYLMSGAPPLRVALAGLLPGVVMGAVQAGLLYAVVHLVLGLTPVHAGATLALMFGTAAVFAGIMQLIGAALGPAGRVMALALLMLQLTSSGGTYPVQTSPSFFQAVHPLLPMTYVVEAIRNAVDGGTAAIVTHDALVLAVFGVAALLLTVLLAARKRRMRTADLHPELVL